LFSGKNIGDAFILLPHPTPGTSNPKGDTRSLSEEGNEGY